MIEYEEKFGRLRKQGDLIKFSSNVYDFEYTLLSSYKKRRDKRGFKRARSHFLREGYIFEQAEEKETDEGKTQSELQQEERA